MSQTVCITGAGRGLGLGFTEHYLAAGWQVLAVARHATDKKELQALSQKFGSRLELVSADVTDTKSLATLKKRWETQPLDLLINNAGVMLDQQTDFSDLSADALRQSFEVNAIAPAILTQMALPALRKSKKPVVAMISSLMASIADNGSGGYYAYRSSKVALNMLTRSLSVDCPWLLAIVMHPGWVQTDMGGSHAPTTISESVQGLSHVIAGLKPEDSGQFKNFRGQTLPW